MILDTVSEKIQFTIENNKYELPYVDIFVRPTEYSTLKMKIENIEPSAESEFELFSCEEINVDSSISDPEY